MDKNGASCHIKYNRFYFWIDCKNYIKNWKYRLRLRFSRTKKRNVLYFVFDPDKRHPGLADRLKALVIVYNISRLNHYEFKYYWKTPFSLGDYLISNENREIETNNLEYSVFDTRLLTEVNWREVSHLKPNKQYHCYLYVGNEMPRVFSNTGLKWSDLFHDLFTPSHKLQQAFDALQIVPRTYISVHLRFVNALDHFEHTFFDNHIDSEEEKLALIEKCKNGILDIMKENPNVPVFVFSDSARFLQSLKGMQVQTLDSRNIGHAGLTGNDESVLKSFLDLYVMSQGKAIYRIRAKELYNVSEYSRVAAAIDDIPFYNKDI